MWRSARSPEQGPSRFFPYTTNDSLFARVNAFLDLARFSSLPIQTTGYALYISEIRQGWYLCWIVGRNHQTETTPLQRRNTTIYYNGVAPTAQLSRSPLSSPPI